MSRCVQTLLRWNVLVELNWLSLSTELVRMVMNGWGSQKLHTLTLFTCYCIVCIFFFPHLVVPSMSSYLPRLLFYFVFISLEKSAFLVPCGQVLVFSTQIGNIPLMDPSSAPFHFHYWACFVCYIIGNETVIKKKFPYCTCEYLWVKDVKKQRALYQHQRHRTHNLVAAGV